MELHIKDFANELKITVKELRNISKQLKISKIVFTDDDQIIIRKHIKGEDNDMSDKNKPLMPVIIVLSQNYYSLNQIYTSRIPFIFLQMVRGLSRISSIHSRSWIAKNFSRIITPDISFTPVVLSQKPL